MAKTLLDRIFLKKIASTLNKKPEYVNVLVSQKADKHSISPRAAMALVAKQYKIGTTVYLKKLEPSEKDEVRGALSSSGTQSMNRKVVGGNEKKPRINSSPREILGKSVEYLIQDQELKKRCKDLLLASSNFDRPINQATLVLEDRIRKKAQPSKRMVGADLVNYSFRSDLSQTILKTSENPDEQDGFANIARGVMLALRNPTHHHLTNSFTREEATKVCMFIDVLLKIVDRSEKIR